MSKKLKKKKKLINKVKKVKARSSSRKNTHTEEELIIKVSKNNFF